MANANNNQRFATLTDEEIQKLLTDKDSARSKKAAEEANRVFSVILVKRNSILGWE